MPFATSSFLSVVRPGATSSVLVPCDIRPLDQREQIRKARPSDQAAHSLSGAHGSNDALIQELVDLHHA